jgi:hypothetical protein
VVRRLRPKGDTLPSEFNLSTCDEYALVNGNQWEIATADALVPGEEQLPMFGVTYTESDGRKRRVLSSLVPVGKRETYMGAATNAPVLAGADPQEPLDPRKAVLLRQVTDPWRSLITQAEKALADFDTPGPSGLDPGDPSDNDDERAKVKKAADDQADLLSWYILLDYGDYLEKYLPDVWAVIAGDAAPDTLDDANAQAALLTRMQNASYTGPGAPTLTLPEALVNIREWRDSLESTTLPYSTADPAHLPASPPFPDFHFLLNSAQLKELVAPPSASTATLDDLVNDALQEVDTPASTPPLPLAAQMTTLDGREPGWFIIRCVFERPNCGPLKPVVISEPTQPFQMAGFFDPDAPARPIRINLPMDTTPAGLRKFDKNTAFVMSDVLACQMERMGSLTLGDLVLSVLPWPLHKDLPSQEGCGESGAMEFGMICSISIPIITICAMIMLMIIVTLLDLVLKWKLFFMLCFPFPKLKAKE